MLTLSRLLLGRLPVRERLRLLLMTLNEFRRLLDVILLDLPPLTIGTLGRRVPPILFLQMLPLESLRFRVMLVLKLPQLRRAIALRILLLLHTIVLELLQLDVVLTLQRLRLHPMLAF